MSSDSSLTDYTTKVTKGKNKRHVKAKDWNEPIKIVWEFSYQTQLAFNLDAKTGVKGKIELDDVVMWFTESIAEIVRQEA